MSIHSVVLMRDGEVVTSERPNGHAAAVESFTQALRSIAGPGCYRLTIDGNEINGRLALDVAGSLIDGPPKPPPSRDTFARRRHRDKPAR